MSEEGTERRTPLELDQFLQHLTVERGLSAKSVEAYRSDLSKFFGFVRKPPARITREDVRRFLGHQRSEGLSASTTARRLVALRTFYRFLLLEKAVEADPTENVDAPRPFKHLPSYLTTKEVDALLEAPSTETSVGLRDRAMLEVLYATGLRVSELTGLNLDGLNADAGFVLVMGKGGKERVVPLGEVARDWVSRYRSESRPLLLKEKESRALFVTARGGA